jgi:nitric oxide reductase NorD protein
VSPQFTSERASFTIRPFVKKVRGEGRSSKLFRSCPHMQSAEMAPNEQLTARLTEHLGRATAVELVEALARTAGRPDSVRAALILLDELEEVSPKSARCAIEAFPELMRRGCLAHAVPWLDLGIAIAGSSGAAAMKYFKESPLLLCAVESDSERAQMLEVALEWAEQDPNVTLELFRVAPELTRILPVAQLRAWGEIGAELARVDYVVGVEFIRQSPQVVRVLRPDDLRAWAVFGMKLVAQNSLGRTDYLGTLEFFRTSPAILGDLDGDAVRQAVVTLGSLLADRSPDAAVAFLAEAPAIMRRLPGLDWRLRVLRYGALVGERDAEAALAYLRRAPELAALIGDVADAGSKFETWFRAGMETLAYSVEGGQAYFALESVKALASAEQAMSGVPLRFVARSLKLFAEALCGTDVTIRALPEFSGADKEPVRATVGDDGRSIALPAILRRYPTREENIRLYHVMTAHEAGHLEFGTYHLNAQTLADLVEEVRRRTGRDPRGEQDVSGKPVAPVVQTLGQFFNLYPQPGLIRDLWTILEDARVDYLLRREYPGLSRDLARLARDAATTRSLGHGLSVRELVVDALLLLTTAEPGTVRIPDPVAEIVERAWRLCQRVLRPEATAEDAIRVAHQVYGLLEEIVGASSQREASGGSVQEPNQGAGPRSSEELTGDYRPVTNWAYRGAMNPDRVRDRSRTGEESVGSPGGSEGDLETAGGGIGGSASPAEAVKRDHSAEAPHREATGEGLTAGEVWPTVLEEWLLAENEQRELAGGHAAGARVFRYHEWDAAIQDYRTNWCQVVERAAAEGPSDFIEETLAAHRAGIRLLRRYFESLRPPGLRRVPGRSDGDEVDLDAVVRSRADAAAGVEPSDRLYVRREKRERRVAAAFLIDMSGSTSRQLSDGRRIIDVEKESLVLLCEALEAVGDHYAVYGYSGRGRFQVEFFVLKEFGEPIGGRAAYRLGGIAPLHQNRDGAAIRHATRKLLAQAAKTRLLVLLNDGRPLDDGYRDDYSLEDTKAALREARFRGVEPFCITVDREADDYVRRLYGDVRFLVIDRVETLPERLPMVYRRLTLS